jgi:hypothetical protein
MNMNSSSLKDSIDIFGFKDSSYFIKLWKESDNYIQDIDLIKDLYDGKLYSYDKLLSPLFKTLSSDKFKNNTIVIFLGDHGESFMEHDDISHGHNLYDEFLTIPALVKLPQNSTLKNMPNQLNLKTFYDIIVKIINGSSWDEATKLINDKYILSGNCKGDLFSIRFDNKWKYFFNILTNESKLYDIEKNPSENQDIYNETLKTNPLLIGELHNELLNQLIIRKKDNLNYQDFCILRQE